MEYNCTIYIYIYRTTLVLRKVTVLCDLLFTAAKNNNLAMKWGEFKMQENCEKSDSPKLYVKLKKMFKSKL